MAVSSIIGVLTEAMLRFLLKALGTAPIPPEATGIVAIIIAFFACLTVVVKRMTED